MEAHFPPCGYHPIPTWFPPQLLLLPSAVLQQEWTSHGVKQVMSLLCSELYTGLSLKENQKVYCSLQGTAWSNFLPAFLPPATSCRYSPCKLIPGTLASLLFLYQECLCLRPFALAVPYSWKTFLSSFHPAQFSGITCSKRVHCHSRSLKLYEGQLLPLDKYT